MIALPGTIFRRLSRRVLVLAACVVSACSPLSGFNAVAGRDSDSELLASDIAFGSHPRQKLDIYGPRLKTGNTPVVMFFYGGSWDSGRREDYTFVGRALASKGYVVVIADYRLVPEVVFPAFIEDNAKAVRWVRDNIAPYGGDGSRLALMGHSAGAYNATMLALDPRYLRQAGVNPSIVKALVGLAGPYDFLPFTSPSAVAALGAWPRPIETQPVSYVTSAAPPAFLGTGDKDTTVKPINTKKLAALLRQQNTSVVERYYPDVDHVGIMLAISRLLRNRGPVLDDVGVFLDKHLPLNKNLSARQR